MLKNRFKIRNSLGFVHHMGLAALVVIVGFGIYGTYRLVASHADSYSFSTAAGTGCTLAGRVWNGNTSNCTKKCLTASSTFNANGTAAGYCSGYVAPAIGIDNCTSTLHRRYVEGVGCARRPDRVSTDNAVQCQNAYPNYEIVTGSDQDKCVAKSVVTTAGGGTTSTGGTTTGTTSGSQTGSDAIGKSVCTMQLGRVYSDGACQRTCQPFNQKSVALELTGSADHGICTGWYTTGVSQDYCTATLHRIWRDDVCLRHRPQVDTMDAAQCLAGYPYYNADFTSPQRTTGTDVCEVSAAVAKYNEAHNILGTSSSTGSSNTGSSSTGDTNTGSSSTGDTSTGSSNTGTTTGSPSTNTGSDGTTNSGDTDGGVNTDPTVPPITAVSKTITVESLSRSVCDQLGREWVPAGKNSAGKKVAAGCSTESCFNQKLELHKRNGSYYCDGYATGSISKQKCNDLHRKWIAAVKACASRPNQDHKAGSRVIKSSQCAGKYTTYVYRTDQYDECLKPGTVDHLKNVARVASLPFVKVSTLSRAALCNVLPHKHWDGHGCVKDRAIQHVSGSTASASGTIPALTAAGCATHHRKYVNGTCTKTCSAKGYVLVTANPYDYCRKKGSNTPAPASKQCSNPDTVSGTCTGQTPQTLTYKKLSCASFTKRFPHTAVCPTAQTNNIDSNKPGATTYHCASGKTGTVSRQAANVIYYTTACSP